MKKLTRFCILFLLSILIFTSCSNIMGYSVLLWSMPEYGLSDGDVVPVYIKSNISQTYVIGTNNEDERIEIPLWQITTPVSKGKIDDEAAKYAEYQHIYARVAFDGLPMREAAVNTSKQVYRLRKDEVIKVLYKGEGQAVMSGQNAMEGIILCRDIKPSLRLIHSHITAVVPVDRRPRHEMRLAILIAIIVDPAESPGQDQERQPESQQRTPFLFLFFLLFGAFHRRDLRSGSLDLRRNALVFRGSSIGWAALRCPGFRRGIFRGWCF